VRWDKCLPMSSRLALGTVQFGLPYGIANQAGQVSRDEAAAILGHAWAAGIDTLDTAISYGESEQQLGKIGVGQWRVVSKLPAIPESCTDVAAWVQKSIHGSLDRLRIPKLHGLLLHRSEQLLGSPGDALYQALVKLKDQNKVGKIGVSIYDPVELDALWSRYRLDLVQAPFNILDRRLATSGWLTRLHQAGVEVHVRSTFLQGLLLMDAVDRPAKFNRWQPLWDEWHRWLGEQALTPLQACLGFAYSQFEIDRVVVGVDSLKQLQEILVGVKGPVVALPTALMSGDLDLINPSRWGAA
jgi:aryl-alcohol dehydrogenase-like predicted oxidoreductase